MDVFIEVLDIPYTNKEYTKLKVLWWNKGQGAGPYLIDSKHQRIKIKSEHYTDWEQLHGIQER